MLGLKSIGLLLVNIWSADLNGGFPLVNGPLDQMNNFFLLKAQCGWVSAHGECIGGDGAAGQAYHNIWFLCRIFGNYKLYNMESTVSDVYISDANK